MKKTLAIIIVLAFFASMTHLVALSYGGVWQAYLVFPSIVMAIGLFTWSCIYLLTGK